MKRKAIVPRCRAVKRMYPPKPHVGAWMTLVERRKMTTNYAREFDKLNVLVHVPPKFLS